MFFISLYICFIYFLFKCGFTSQQEREGKHIQSNSRWHLLFIILLFHNSFHLAVQLNGSSLTPVLLVLSNQRGSSLRLPPSSLILNSSPCLPSSNPLTRQDHPTVPQEASDPTSWKRSTSGGRCSELSEQCVRFSHPAPPAKSLKTL